MSRITKSGKSQRADSCRGVPNLARLVTVLVQVFQNLVIGSARRVF